MRPHYLPLEHDRRPSRRPFGPPADARARVVVAVTVVGLVATVLSARFTGASAALPGGLADAGPVVRWALPVVRVVHDVAASLTVGALLLAASVIPGATSRASAAPDEPRRAVALEVAAGSGFLWALAGAVGLVLTFADAAGMPLSNPVFGSSLLASVWSIEVLRIDLISVVAAVVVASGAALARTRSVTVALTAVALFGVLVLGLAGHAGGSADHETAVNALGAHLLSASVWVGGLLALIVLHRVLGDALPVVVRRYSAIALWCYATLGVSGVMAASTRLGGWSDLGTAYGLLVVVKVVAFVLLGVAGWWHRSHAVAEIERAEAAAAVGRGARTHRGPVPLSAATRRPFLRLAVVETLVMGLAFGVATALARSQPPVPRDDARPQPRARGDRLPGPAGADVPLVADRVALRVALPRHRPARHRPLPRGGHPAAPARRLVAGRAHHQLGRRLARLHLGDERDARHLRPGRLLVAHDPAHGRGDGRADLPRPRRAR